MVAALVAVDAGEGDACALGYAMRPASGGGDGEGGGVVRLSGG